MKMTAVRFDFPKTNQISNISMKIENILNTTLYIFSRILQNNVKLLDKRKLHQ